jgi:hypothetical protein
MHWADRYCFRVAAVISATHSAASAATAATMTVVIALA